MPCNHTQEECICDTRIKCPTCNDMFEQEELAVNGECQECYNQ